MLIVFYNKQLNSLINSFQCVNTINGILLIVRGQPRARQTPAAQDVQASTRSRSRAEWYFPRTRSRGLRHGPREVACGRRQAQADPRQHELRQESVHAQGALRAGQAKVHFSSILELPCEVRGLIINNNQL